MSEIEVPPVSGESSGCRWLSSPCVLTWQKDRRRDRQTETERDKLPGVSSYKSVNTIMRTHGHDFI